MPSSGCTRSTLSRDCLLRRQWFNGGGLFWTGPARASARIRGEHEEDRLSSKGDLQSSIFLDRGSFFSRHRLYSLTCRRLSLLLPISSRAYPSRPESSSSAALLLTKRNSGKTAGATLLWRSVLPSRRIFTLMPCASSFPFICSSFLYPIVRTNELCRRYSEACIELCKEMDLKVVDLWNALQRVHDWENVCFTWVFIVRFFSSTLKISSVCRASSRLVAVPP